MFENLEFRSNVILRGNCVFYLIGINSDRHEIRNTGAPIAVFRTEEESPRDNPN